MSVAGPDPVGSGDPAGARGHDSAAGRPPAPAAPDDAGLRLTGLSVGYRGGPGRGRRRTRVVLAGLDLVALPGELTMLLGPNGSGKSTLLRTVACLQRALAGRVQVDGGDLTRMAARERARLLAVVLTERFDPGLLTAGEVVALGRHPHLGPSGSLSPVDRSAVAEAMATMHAENLARERVAELSDGQRQRIMVARALAQQPRLLVLDEPSAFLDAPARIELLERLRVIAAERDIAVVLSTHDVETALRAGGAAWLIGGGRGTGLGDDAPRPSAVISGSMDDLAASGAINGAFDTPAVRFRAEHGTFGLR